jgi:hypothetical protein
LQRLFRETSWSGESNLRQGANGANTGVGAGVDEDPSQPGEAVFVSRRHPLSLGVKQTNAI